MQAYKLKGKIDSAGNLVITDPNANVLQKLDIYKSEVAVSSVVVP